MADKKELLLIEIRENGARVVKRNIEGVGKAGDATADQMDRLKGILAGLVSARVLRDTIMLADAYANMLNRLRVVTESTWELNAAMEGVFTMSRETRTSMEANIDMYARVAINTKQLGLQYKDVLRFAKQLNHAIILSGVTAREAQWGMVQFSQALASNALRGDELRAILEQLPVVTDVISAHFNVTRGELRELGFQGRITAKEIIKAFETAEESLRTRFEKRIPTIDQGITVLRSAILKFVGDIDQGIQFTSNFAGALLWVADHMETFGRFAMIAGTVLGTIYLKNLILIIAQMRLFSLEVLKVHPLATALLLAGTALVIYSDKIKIASDSNATLADTMKALGENAKTTYKFLRDGIASLFDGKSIETEFSVTLENVLVDGARFIDKFLGLFVGAGEVIKKVFKDIPNYAKHAWNAILSGIETIADYIIAVFASIGDMIQIFALNIKTGMGSLAGASEQLLAGNAGKAAEYADQAALSFKNAATQGFKGFSNILGENLKAAASEDSLAGAKFKVEKAGESIGDAFGRGFAMSDVIAAGVKSIIGRAKTAAAARGGDAPATEDFTKWSPTPVQSQLIKEMTGDIGRLIGEMEQLDDIWQMVSSRTEDKQLINFEQYTRKMAQLRLESMKTATDVKTGFQRGFLTLGLEISNFAELAEKTITNAFKNMEDALVSFVTTGKVDFKGLVDSMLADLTRLLTRQAIMGLLTSMAGGGGMGSTIAGAFGVIPNTGTPAVPRALGGAVSPGMQYMVGERRPELFQPAQPGHITPAPIIQPPAQEGAVTIINVASEEEAIAAMQSAEGKRVIRNEIRTYKSGRS